MELQRTDTWRAERLGKFTSSEIYRLMTEPQKKEDKENGELSPGAKTYVLEKIVEEIGGFIPEGESNATIYGKEHENQAKYWYSFKTGYELVETGFILKYDGYGGSPDAIVLDRDLGVTGALEVKCPYNSVNHLKHCLISCFEEFKKSHPDYYWQCLSHIETTNSVFCDFVSFDPRINHEIGLFMWRFEANNTYIKNDLLLMRNKINKAMEYKTRLKIQLGLL